MRAKKVTLKYFEEWTGAGTSAPQPMPCTSVHEVQLICLTHRQARARLETGGGWRRTCVRRERRWPSFIIWRWAGRALGGWIRCRWRTSLLQLLPPPRQYSTTVTSRPIVAGLPARVKRRPRSPAPGNRPRSRAGEGPRSPPGRAPRRRHGEPPPEKRPSGRDGNRQRGAPALPGAGNPPRKARQSPLRAGGQRRAGGARLRSAS
jgi:hypothetical protein